MLRTEPYFPVRQVHRRPDWKSAAPGSNLHQTQPRWTLAVHDSRPPLRLLLIVLKILTVAPANEHLPMISIPNCSNILCGELIQIVRNLKDRGFNRAIAPALLTTTLCFFPEA
jgi:hypothetical protein